MNVKRFSPIPGYRNNNTEIYNKFELLNSSLVVLHLGKFIGWYRPDSVWAIPANEFTKMWNERYQAWRTIGLARGHHSYALLRSLSSRPP